MRSWLLSLLGGVSIRDVQALELENRRLSDRVSFLDELLIDCNTAIKIVKNERNALKKEVAQLDSSLGSYMDEYDLLAIERNKQEDLLIALTEEGKELRKKLLNLRKGTVKRKR